MKIFKKVGKSINNEKQFYLEIIPQSSGLLAFDIGSNLGINTSHLLNLGYRVISVEPEKRNFEALEFRYQKDSDVTLVNAAVSNSSSEKYLNIEKGNSLHTFNNKWKSKAQDHFDFEVSFDEKQLVKTVTLDSLILEYGLPEVLKVDVEGHELEVFEGLSKIVPIIIFESNLPEFMEETIKIIEILRDLSAHYVFKISAKNEILMYSEKLLFQLVEKGEKISIEIICKRI